jgi:hypothetical protein
MTTEQKIEAIKNAIEMATNRQSKMDDVSWSVPALASLNIRHLMNNLGAISTKYLECGVHKGGLFCSTIRNNTTLVDINATDSFASDADSEDKAYYQFSENVAKCKTDGLHCNLLIGDTFEIGPDNIVGPVDLYLYDAAHDYDSQRKAITHFLPAMADEFILCVDDFDWPEVMTGTEEGIKDAGVDVLFQQTFEGNNHDNDGWWNGFAVFLLRKKKEKKGKKK